MVLISWTRKFLCVLQRVSRSEDKREEFVKKVGLHDRNFDAWIHLHLRFDAVQREGLSFIDGLVFVFGLHGYASKDFANSGCTGNPLEHANATHASSFRPHTTSDFVDKI